MKHPALYFCWSQLLGCLFSVPTQARMFSGDGSFFQHSKLLDYDETSDSNEIIVILEPKQMNRSFSVRENVLEMLGTDDGGEIINVYENIFDGVMIRGFVIDHLRALLDNNRVKYVSLNTRFSLNTDELNAAWGLDRIDQPSLPLDSVYDYTYDGTGVTAYVMDTGIRFSHDDFEGRASCGYNAMEGQESCEDLVGHGTHVAGIIGGKMYGVAKNVQLVAIKVVSSSRESSLSDILGGFDYILKQKRDSPKQPMVINMSLGGQKSPALNDAINEVVDAGITVVVAAGNDSDNACSYSPASAEKAITVGATDWSDHISQFSNFGRCVQIYAPGTDVVSTGYQHDSAAAAMSGTSMACPHVTGVVALYLSKSPVLTPDQIESRLRNDALRNRVEGLPQSSSSEDSGPDIVIGRGGFFSKFISNFINKISSHQSSPDPQAGPNLLLNKKNY